MKIRELNIENCLTTNEFDPSPHRFNSDEKSVAERQIPLVFICNNCKKSITFTPNDFERHDNSKKSNLKPTDFKSFENYLKTNNIFSSSFIDFYCPTCKQPIIMIFDGGTSGYYGIYSFQISNVLVIKF